MRGARAGSILTVALSALLLAAVMPLNVQAAAGSPRVVIVVGPVGGLTDTYRGLARAGADEARHWNASVAEIYSPDATWPRVRAALQGASVVVYLGHGNGFPSPYGSRLRTSVQDGFGLNPVADQGDSAHQYFGESYIAGQVHLAPGAVVLMFRLCYASGNSEPGVAEGSEPVAQQRIDNFAAGFLAAGASAVVADAYATPASYLHALLGAGRSARTAWDQSRTGNGHARAFPSARTPGAVAFMDPQQPSAGFTRSLVLAAGAAGVVPAGPVGGRPVPPGGWDVVLPPQPTSAPDAFDLGASPGTPTLSGMPLAGATVQLGLPVDVPKGVKLGTSYELGARWIPLDDAAAATEPAPDAAALVARESAASLVDVQPAKVGAGGLTTSVGLPGATGRYRLEVTLHDHDGIALPYAVQASIPGVVVHVGGPGAAWLDLPPALSVTAATLASVQVLVTNGEADAWGGCPAASRQLGPDGGGATCPAVRLVGRWVPLGTAAVPPAMVTDLAIPAATAQASWLSGPVPSVPGTYLLVASIERSGGGEPPAVLGRPVTTIVDVVAAPLIPVTPAG